VEINREEVERSLAMNRLRHAYLKIAPALEPYFTTGHHDDEQGLAASYLAGGARLRRWGQFLVNTPTIVATVDAALAAAIVVLVVRAVAAATTVAVVAGTVASWSFGRRCCCSNAEPWTRCAVRRRGSPRRQTKPERLAASSPLLQPMERSRPRWPVRAGAGGDRLGPLVVKLLDSAHLQSVRHGRHGCLGAHSSLMVLEGECARSYREVWLARWRLPAA
jgi:hypothetical protein